MVPSLTGTSTSVMTAIGAGEDGDSFKAKVRHEREIYKSQGPESQNKPARSKPCSSKKLLLAVTEQGSCIPRKLPTWPGDANVHASSNDPTCL